MDCQHCENEVRIQALEKDMERNSNAHREFYGKFAEVDKKQAVTEERYSNIMATVGKIDEKLSFIADKPAKRWETVIACVITVVVTSIITYILSGKM